MLKRGQERSERLCSVSEKKEKKEGVWKEQPTCYHTVFNNSVAATRGLHVHATAVQCLLSVCATHEKAPIQKSKRSALSVSSRLQGGRSSLSLQIEVHDRVLSDKCGTPFRVFPAETSELSSWFRSADSPS